MDTHSPRPSAAETPAKWPAAPAPASGRGSPSSQSPLRSARVVVKTESQSPTEGSVPLPPPAAAAAKPAYKPLFRFINSEDANKPSIEKRKHVMRDYRRKQRWEELQQRRAAMGLDERATEIDEDTKPTEFALRDTVDSKRSSSKKLNKRKRHQETQQALTQILPPVSETPVLDVFVERFVDAFAPIPDWGIKCGRSDAIRTAATVRYGTPLLRSAFIAVSTTLMGQVIGDRRIVSAGHKNYLAVLKALQTALTDSEESRSDAVLATVILLMAYESLQHTTERALINHCMGALKLIEFRGPESHKEGVAHQCFAELQPYWMATAIVTRSPSFLARDEWKRIPWSGNGVEKDIMQRLLDIVAHIPGLLAQHDKFDAAVKDRSISFAEYNRQEKMLWRNVTDVEQSLRAWKREVADTYPDGSPVESAEPLGTDPFPIFLCRDLASGQVLTPPNLVYPDPQLARTLAMYWSAMLLLSSVDKRQSDAIRPYEQYDSACLICRTMEYYIRTVPGHMINRMAFPMRVAYDAMPEGGSERTYLGEVFQLVERKKMLKSWGKLMPDVSAKAPD